MVVSKFTQINDLVVMDKIKKGSRWYYQLSCSYGHTLDVRCDSLNTKRHCVECGRNVRCEEKLPTVREGFTKGQLKVIERLPHKPYEKPKVKVFCTCGNISIMYSCNVVKNSQSFSCGNCQPYYKTTNKVLYMFSGKNLEKTWIVDIEHIGLIFSTSWTIHKDCSNLYVRESSGDRRFLHRVITNCPEDMFVDHINGNGLDNRKSNLRVVSKKENAKNQRLCSNNSSGKMGVNFREDMGKWRSTIGHDGKRVNLGHFETKEGAILVREKAEDFYNFHINHGREDKAELGDDL